MACINPDILDRCAGVLEVCGYDLSSLGHPDNGELCSYAATTLTLSTNLDIDQAVEVIEELIR